MELSVMAGPAGCRADLSLRDQAILSDLRLVRLLTGAQLERLHFADLSSANSRTSSRRRSLNRLKKLQLVTHLDRRIGGERAGSGGLVYTLDAAGHRWLDQCDAGGAATGYRARKPWPIGLMFVRHSLDVAELYVRLREAERAAQLELIKFLAEPASWHRTAVAALKPDAFAVMAHGDLEEHIWIEVDRGTESLGTLRRKLIGYLDEARAGDLGPDGVFPRVLVTVATRQRQEAVATLKAQLPEPASQLISIELFEQVFTGVARPPPVD